MVLLYVSIVALIIVLLGLFVLIALFWRNHNDTQGHTQSGHTESIERDTVTKCPCGNDKIWMIECTDCHQPVEKCSTCFPRLLQLQKDGLLPYESSLLSCGCDKGSEQMRQTTESQAVERLLISELEQEQQINAHRYDTITPKFVKIPPKQMRGQYQDLIVATQHTEQIIPKHVSSIELEMVKQPTVELSPSSPPPRDTKPMNIRISNLESMDSPEPKSPTSQKRDSHNLQPRPTNVVMASQNTEMGRIFNEVEANKRSDQERLQRASWEQIETELERVRQDFVGMLQKTPSDQADAIVRDLLQQRQRPKSYRAFMSTNQSKEVKEQCELAESTNLRKPSEFAESANSKMLRFSQLEDDSLSVSESVTKSKSEISTETDTMSTVRVRGIGNITRCSCGCNKMMKIKCAQCQEPAFGCSMCHRLLAPCACGQSVECQPISHVNQSNGDIEKGTPTRNTTKISTGISTRISSKMNGIAKCPCGCDKTLLTKCAHCDQPAMECSNCYRRLSACGCDKRMSKWNKREEPIKFVECSCGGSKFYYMECKECHQQVMACSECLQRVSPCRCDEKMDEEQSKMSGRDIRKSEHILTTNLSANMAPSIQNDETQAVEQLLVSELEQETEINAQRYEEQNVLSTEVTQQEHIAIADNPDMAASARHDVEVVEEKPVEKRVEESSEEQSLQIEEESKEQIGVKVEVIEAEAVQPTEYHNLLTADIEESISNEVNKVERTQTAPTEPCQSELVEIEYLKKQLENSVQAVAGLSQLLIQQQNTTNKEMDVSPETSAQSVTHHDKQSAPCEHESNAPVCETRSKTNCEATSVQQVTVVTDHEDSQDTQSNSSKEVVRSIPNDKDKSSTTGSHECNQTHSHDHASSSHSFHCMVCIPGDDANRRNEYVREDVPNHPHLEYPCAHACRPSVFDSVFDDDDAEEHGYPYEQPCPYPQDHHSKPLQNGQTVDQNQEYIWATDSRKDSRSPITCQRENKLVNVNQEVESVEVPSREQREYLEKQWVHSMNSISIDRANRDNIPCRSSSRAADATNSTAHLIRKRQQKITGLVHKMNKCFDLAEKVRPCCPALEKVTTKDIVSEMQRKPQRRKYIDSGEISLCE